MFLYIYIYKLYKFFDKYRQFCFFKDKIILYVIKKKEILDNVNTIRFSSIFF